MYFQASPQKWRLSIRIIVTQPVFWRLITALCTGQEGAGQETPGWHHCSQTPSSPPQSGPAPVSGRVGRPPEGTNQEAAGKCSRALHTLILYIQCVHLTLGRLTGSPLAKSKFCLWINEYGSSPCWVVTCWGNSIWMHWLQSATVNYKHLVGVQTKSSPVLKNARGCTGAGVLLQVSRWNHNPGSPVWVSVCLSDSKTLHCTAQCCILWERMMLCYTRQFYLHHFSHNDHDVNSTNAAFTLQSNNQKCVLARMWLATTTPCRTTVQTNERDPFFHTVLKSFWTRL